MMITIALVNTSTPSLSNHFWGVCVVIIFKVYSLNNFQVVNTVLLIINYSHHAVYEILQNLFILELGVCNV